MICTCICVCVHVLFGGLLEAAVPYGLAMWRSFSALPNFDAATIFIDLVIFWMFLIDFNRRETSVTIKMCIRID